MRLSWPRLLLATTVAAGLMPIPAAYATVTSVVSDDVLEVSGDDANDSIEVTCVGGDVKVNSADPGSGVADCADLTFIIISAGAVPIETDTMLPPRRPHPARDHSNVAGPREVRDGDGQIPPGHHVIDRNRTVIRERGLSKHRREEAVIGSCSCPEAHRAPA